MPYAGPAIPDPGEVGLPPRLRAAVVFGLTTLVLCLPAVVAAFVVGLVSYTVSGRMRVPPLVVVVPAVVPMLPGLSIYRGLSLLGEGERGFVAGGLLAIQRLHNRRDATAHAGATPVHRATATAERGSPPENRVDRTGDGGWPGGGRGATVKQ